MAANLILADVRERDAVGFGQGLLAQPDAPLRLGRGGRFRHMRDQLSDHSPHLVWRVAADNLDIANAGAPQGFLLHSIAGCGCIPGLVVSGSLKFFGV